MISKEQKQEENEWHSLLPMSNCLQLNLQCKGGNTGKFCHKYLHIKLYDVDKRLSDFDSVSSPVKCDGMIMDAHWPSLPGSRAQMSA